MDIFYLILAIIETALGVLSGIYWYKSHKDGFCNPCAIFSTVWSCVFTIVFFIKAFI